MKLRWRVPDKVTDFQHGGNISRGSGGISHVISVISQRIWVPCHRRRGSKNHQFSQNFGQAIWVLYKVRHPQIPQIHPRVSQQTTMFRRMKTQLLSQLLSQFSGWTLEHPQFCRNFWHEAPTKRLKLDESLAPSGYAGGIGRQLRMAVSAGARWFKELVEKS